MIYNKQLTFLFVEDNDSISAKSAAQITGLCDSLASCSFTLTHDLVFKIISDIVPFAKFLLTEYAAS